MLSFLRSGQRWLTGLIVVGVGAVFVFFLGLGGPMTGSLSGTVVEVGPYSFDGRTFERLRAQRERFYEQQLGDQYNARAMRETLDNLAARDMIEQALLALEAQELGLTVSKPEIERLVLQDPGFRDSSGRFSQDAFEDYASYEFGSQRNFMEDRRRALLSIKMFRLLYNNAAVSENEAREAVRSQLDEVRIAFVALDRAKPPEDLEFDESEIRRTTEEREEDLRALYDELDARYHAPEQVRARHILISVASGADEHQVQFARTLAEQARGRVLAGEDFGEVAKQLSQDPGSKANGGDLGFFGRGQMIKAFEDAAFALEPGGLSEVVRSDFGFHVIRLEEHKEAVDRPFDTVREELAGEWLRREAARTAARGLAEKLADAIEAGQTLEQAARAEGLTLERSGSLTRRADGFVPGLGPAQDLMATAFVLEPGQSSPRIFESGEKLALLQLLERKDAEEEDIEARLAETRQRLLNERRTARNSAWLNQRRRELIDAGELHVNLDDV